MKKIDFTIGEEPWVYSDSILVPDGVDIDIEAEKQARYEQWLAIVNPPETK